ncbi:MULTISPECIES: NUDIX domain-containing protein [Acinetobacter]|uniref:NUDIX hydrolase n=1 Tax=Acinetobacter TaxID=469 RepID=UPI000235ED7B|nr:MULTISPECIES: NUDIX domain-containing protein [Acinetobacter]KXZ74524.1 NUDIX domain protein [Acinetobacter venetianus]GAB01843.1 hypothetical protein ACT4_023_00190 [Acinetobacter sp. NBRC 100985]
MKKVVPVILRNPTQGLEILAFRHPLAGSQLVKGTIEQGEKYDEAAIRELYEEAGLTAEPNPKLMGSFMLKSNQQDWHFYLCETLAELPETWVHHCQDGGGLDFEFFWFPLYQQPNDNWHVMFQEALGFIKEQQDLF